MGTSEFKKRRHAVAQTLAAVYAQKAVEHEEQWRRQQGIPTGERLVQQKAGMEQQWPHQQRVHGGEHVVEQSQQH